MRWNVLSRGLGCAAADDRLSLLVRRLKWRWLRLNPQLNLILVLRPELKQKPPSRAGGLISGEYNRRYLDDWLLANGRRSHNVCQNNAVSVMMRQQQWRRCEGEFSHLQKIRMKCRRTQKVQEKFKKKNRRKLEIKQEANSFPYFHTPIDGLNKLKFISFFLFIIMSTSTESSSSSERQKQRRRNYKFLDIGWPEIDEMSAYNGWGEAEWYIRRWQVPERLSARERELVGDTERHDIRR